MRGEDLPRLLPRVARLETPPHARGRPTPYTLRYRTDGNTPACAGKTAGQARLLDAGEKHPRMRGEDPPSESKKTTSTETPPHARGRLFEVASKNPGDGNTPACAGKTPLPRPYSRRGWKHPRMRGEDYPLAGETLTVIGNTPACAGKTPTGSISEDGVRKHPRMRGEDPCPSKGAGSDQETPPHARGRRKRCEDDFEFFGNTPACAGKTCFYCPRFALV